MAKNIDEAREGHNSNNKDPEYVKAEIIKLHKELEPLEAEQRKINDQMKKLRHRFKGETGIAIADFKAARRLAMMEDEAEQREKRENLATCYNALSQGDQLNWLDVEESKEAA